MSQISTIIILHPPLQKCRFLHIFAQTFWFFCRFLFAALTNRGTNPSFFVFLTAPKNESSFYSFATSFFCSCAENKNTGEKGKVLKSPSGDRRSAEPPEVSPKQLKVGDSFPPPPPVSKPPPPPQQHGWWPRMEGWSRRSRF